eukprot:5724102-Alexandrium_andersonii.AAC.1
MCIRDSACFAALLRALAPALRSQLPLLDVLLPGVLGDSALSEPPPALPPEPLRGGPPIKDSAWPARQ